MKYICSTSSSGKHVPKILGHPTKLKKPLRRTTKPKKKNRNLRQHTYSLLISEARLRVYVHKINSHNPCPDDTFKVFYITITTLYMFKDNPCTHY